jgi:hypothetical protein
MTSSNSGERVTELTSAITAYSGKTPSDAQERVSLGSLAARKNITAITEELDSKRRRSRIRRIARLSRSRA